MSKDNCRKSLHGDYDFATKRAICTSCGKEEWEDYGSWEKEPRIFFCSEACHRMYSKSIFTWYLLYLIAIIRGLFYKWPKQPWGPKGYSSVTCELRNWREAKTMYKHGWIPYCIHKTDGKHRSRMFIVKER